MDRLPRSWDRRPDRVGPGKAPGRPRSRRRTPPSACSPGYTLVELLVALVMVAILARLAIPAYDGVRRVSYNQVALSDLVSARAAIQGQTATLPARGTVVVVGPGRLSFATHVRVSRDVRLTVARNNPSAAGEPQYTITARHTRGTATYTVTQTGRITATGAKL